MVVIILQRVQDEVISGRAGLPTTVVKGATFRVTTAQAPIIALLPTMTPGNKKARAPIKQSVPTKIGAVLSGQ